MMLRKTIAAMIALAAVPAAAQTTRALTNGIEAANGAAKMRVTAITDGILRVRIARGGAFPENASWAVPRNVRMTEVSRFVDGCAMNFPPLAQALERLKEPL